MVEKRYDWTNGAEIGDHSRRKHKILRDYFSQYLNVRCQLPQQSRFRIAIVDGFAGGGRYSCGSPGSPIIFIDELKCTIESLNAMRTARGFATIQFECLLILNDSHSQVIEILKQNVAPLQTIVNKNLSDLKLHVTYFQEPFEHAYTKNQSPALKGPFQERPFQSRSKRTFSC